MATNTTHFNYILPDVGGDDFAWGTMNNDNWIKADAQFKAINDRTISAGAGLTGGGNLSANRSFALTGQALALHNHAANGILARTAAAAYASRSLVGGSGIAVTNANGVAGNPTIAVDDTVLRTTGTQSATGHKTFTNDFSIATSGSTFNANLWFKNNDGVNRATIYARPNRNLEATVYDAAGAATGSFTLTAAGVFSASGGLSGDGSALTGLNASRLAAGTVADARLPGTVVRTSRNLVAGDGLSGGGNLGADRAFAVDNTVVRTDGNQYIKGVKHFATYRTQLGGDNVESTQLAFYRLYGIVRAELISNETNLFYMRIYSAGGTASNDFTFNGATGQLSATSFAGNGANLTNLDVRDAAVGSVGSYAFLTDTTGTTLAHGQTRAGSALRYGNAWADHYAGIPGGTWRLMGYIVNAGGANNRTSLWLRIS